MSKFHLVSKFATLLTLVFLPRASAVTTCSCSNGTPTVSDGADGTLCDTGGEDCSACNANYILSAPAAAGSAQTCVSVDVCHLTGCTAEQKAEAYMGRNPAGSTDCASVIPEAGVVAGEASATGCNTGPCSVGELENSFTCS